MFSPRLHRWFRIPHSLHVRHHQRPKKPRAAVLFIHGLGNTGAAWDEVIEQLPSDIQVYSVDLLGFGNSPQPSWADYDAKTQARSLAATLLKLRNTNKLTIVGHSLGALVAIEVAKRYPRLVDALLLCSPPLYEEDMTKSILPKGDKLLTRFYEHAMSRPNQFLAFSSFAMKYGLADKTFNVTKDNFDSYSRTLRAAIINQTSLKDARELTIPVHIIVGKLDPFVVTSRIRSLARSNSNVKVSSLMLGHEFSPKYREAVTRQLKQLIGQK